MTSWSSARRLLDQVPSFPGWLRGAQAKRYLEVAGQHWMDVAKWNADIREPSVRHAQRSLINNKKPTLSEEGTIEPHVGVASLDLTCLIDVGSELNDWDAEDQALKQAQLQ